MRINHNIAALNTYRQLNSASTAQGKSMEKLSSGLRINKAGDDAAGLAISEKMRGQIRGLDQASRNSQDAISMIQTAEGALSETHDILQRMRELATQASNDTNTTDDREEIQKEINQLTSEVNRIGNTTEFNTKKLLNGDVSIGSGQKLATGGSAPSYVGTSLNGVAVSENATAQAGTYEAKIENLGGQLTKDVGAVALTGGAANGTVTGADTNLNAGSYKIVVASENAVNTTVDTLGTGIAANSNITVAADSTLSDASYDIKIDKATTHTVTSVNTGGVSDLQLGASVPADGTYKISTAATVKNIADDVGTAKDNVITGIRLDADSTYAEGISADSTFKLVGSGTDDNTFTLSLEDADNGTQGSITFTATATEGVQTVRIGDFEIDIDFAALAAGDGPTSSNATDNTFHNAEVKFDVGRNITIENTADATKTVTVDASAGLVNGDFTLDNDGGQFTLDATAANGVTPGQDIYVTVGTNTSYTVELVTDGGGTGSVAGSSKHVFTEAQLLQSANNTNLDLGNGVQVDLDTAALKAAGDGSFETEITTATQASKTAQLVNSTTGSNVGSKQTLDTGNGAKSLEFDVEGVTFEYTGDTVTAGNYNFTVEENTTADDFRLTLTRTSDAEGNADGTVLKNQVSIDPNAKIDLGEGVSVKTAVNMAHNDKATYKIEAGTKDNSLTMQVGANAGQTFAVNMNDMRADALDISNTTASATKIVKDSQDKDITASYRATSDGKEVTNGTDNTGTEYALDVTSAEKATAAVAVLDNAIQAVSQERSKFGAYQNRLEHTINNLNTSSENLTAAESRIRDVDMAKEMMTQTKNSILSQAAQAMLAQANQQPQGVLQLLR